MKTEEIGGLTPSGLGLRGQLAASLGISALVLGLNVVTGAVLSRSLGPEGRGAYVAIVNLPQAVGWLGSLGCAQTLAYFLSRHEAAMGALVGGWLAILIPLILGLLVVTEVALPALFGAQDVTVVAAARVFLLIMLFAPLAEVTYGVLIARRDFVGLNALRVAMPSAMVVALVASFATGILRLETALVITGAVAVVALTLAARRAMQLVGTVRIRPGRALRTLPYAIRAYGTNVGGLLNARLDLMILPMLIGAEPLGLYSVAASASLIIPGVAGGLTYVLFPELARRKREGASLVFRSALATLVGAALVAAALGFWAEDLLDFVYGASFKPSASPLQILLPGTVLYAAASVLWTGLGARGLPGRAATAQLAGVAVTIVGLLLFVGSGGIVAAAWISTASYATVFAAAALLYVHAARHSARSSRAGGARDFAPAPPQHP